MLTTAPPPWVSLGGGADVFLLRTITRAAICTPQEYADLQLVSRSFHKNVRCTRLVFADGVRRGTAARAGRESQILDVGYEALRRDPAAEVRRVKAWAGLPHDGASEARLSAFLGGGARGAAPAPAGKHTYSAEFFGVDDADVASDFAEYRQRFGRFLT